MLFPTCFNFTIDRDQGTITRLYNITCAARGAMYRVAESDTAVGSPGVQNCSVCEAVLTSWCDRKLKAFRLESPEADVDVNFRDGPEGCVVRDPIQPSTQARSPWMYCSS